MTRPQAFFEQFTQAGWKLAEARPRFAPEVEAALKGEMAQEITTGEEPPHPVVDLPSNVQLMQRDNHKLLLYVIPSALDDGFWGVNVAVVEELAAQPLPWALVLLERDRLNRGHWLPGSQVTRLAKERWQTIVPNGSHFEVRPPYLAGADQFADTASLLHLADQP